MRLRRIAVGLNSARMLGGFVVPNARIASLALFRGADSERPSNVTELQPQPRLVVFQETVSETPLTLRAGRERSSED